MAYHNMNYIKRAGFIIAVYQLYKQPDVPDTVIVNTYFPKHFIFISYREWMNIKGMRIKKENINDRILNCYEDILKSFKGDEIKQ